MAQMKKSIIIPLLLLLVIVVAFGLEFWADKSRVVGNHLDSEIDLAFAFADALQMNHPRAYGMIDTNLKPRLDEWMDSHKSWECVRDLDYSWISDGTNLGKKIAFGCFTETSYLSFEVDDIVIKDMKVIDWGEVRETYR